MKSQETYIAFNRYENPANKENHTDSDIHQPTKENIFTYDAFIAHASLNFLDNLDDPTLHLQLPSYRFYQSNEP